MTNSEISAVSHFSGHFDGVFGRLAIGWAFIPTSPSSILTVEIISDGRVVSEATAEHFREDLLAHGIGDGHHQFKCVLPIELFDGKKRIVSARVKGNLRSLAGGPHQINQKLLSLNDAFDSATLNSSPPLSDFQVAMLRGLTTACDTLSEHSRLLQKITTGDMRPTGNAISNLVERESDFVVDFKNNAKSNRDVIIFSIIDWDFRTQRPQHLAANFAKMGCRVTYVSVHLQPLEQGQAGFFVRGKPTHGVYEVVLRCTTPVPSMYAGLTDAEQVLELCAGVDNMISILEIKSPTVILQYPTWLPIANSIAGATIVFDCLDHLAGFSTASPEVIGLEHDLVQSADVVVTSSQYLHDFVNLTRPTTIVRNAAEIEFFGAPPLENIDYGKKPVIGYYGAIAEWFDMDLVYHTAKNKPNWNFVLIGSTDGADITKISKLKNVILTGEIPYKNIPAHLYSFDCCLIPFKLTELIKATNPVKLYEYFAAGKPVVATDIPELRLIPSDLVSLAKTKNDFISAIEHALSENKNKKLQRKLWTLEHSWMIRSRDFLKYVSSLTPKVSIIVLCYNNINLTKACLESIERFSHYDNIELICVNNNSKDETKDYLDTWSKGKPYVKVIHNDINLGFAAGNNVGIEAATGEYLILLNNDTYVTAGWIQDLIRPLVNDKTIGLTGPLTNMIGNEQKINIHYASMEEMATASRKFTLRRKRDVFETDNLAFFCVAIPRHVIEKIGVLDVQFGLGYFEDDDYCQRVLKAGLKLLVADGVFVHHHLSGSFDKDPDKKQKLLKDNRAKFEKKWGPWTAHSYRDAAGFGG